ncbi:class 1 fructose-bisphosphatase [Ignavibacteria bacterium]|nr:class 1 fructose-bisphosphatase [Bacteroidota bacterium]MCZ2133244.1 class 1 fructose-bisphosphatase [Bacteroidota bacterium]
MPIISTNRLITIERHIASEEQLHPEATGEYSGLLRDLTLALRLIARDVRRAGLNDILGFTDTTNVHGETVKKLDDYANDVIFRAMDHGGHLCVMASEESYGLIHIPSRYKKGKYVLVFDPLDGSSNIDVNATIGTIFSIYRRLEPNDTSDGSLTDVLQPGYKQVAAGYASYGSAMNLVYTSGNGVDVFTYDQTIGEFLLTREKVTIPQRGKIYSINEGNYNRWEPRLRQYIDYLKTPSDDGLRPYSLRYIGTAIADVHRTLYYGGIFMYPADSLSPKGKLRLMYELNPLSMLIEQAGGRATDGTRRIMDIMPTDIHERAPVFMGSQDDVLDLETFLRGEHTSQQ